jgi:hypothetical protein
MPPSAIQVNRGGVGRADDREARGPVAIGHVLRCAESCEQSHGERGVGGATGIRCPTAAELVVEQRAEFADDVGADYGGTSLQV